MSYGYYVVLEYAIYYRVVLASIMRIHSTVAV